MIDSDDIRLCANYSLCKSYGESYAKGKKECSGCAGDISPHRQLTSLLDSVIDPLEAAVMHNTPQTMIERYGKAIADIQEKCAALLDLEVSLSEANMLLHHRSMQVIRTLKDAIKR